MFLARLFLSWMSSPKFFKRKPLFSFSLDCVSQRLWFEKISTLSLFPISYTHGRYLLVLLGSAQASLPSVPSSLAFSVLGMVYV
jgi:hypothetical protein